MMKEIKWLYLDREKEYLSSRGIHIGKAVGDYINNSDQFILGEKVAELEHVLSEKNAPYHAVTCANGSDAMVLALMCMDVNAMDRFYTTPYTFISTVESIARTKASAFLCDIDEYDFTVDSIVDLAVSIFGHTLQRDCLIEDAAQSYGCLTNNTQPRFKTVSFHPTKNLGCYGDGGAIFCKRKSDAEKIKLIRNHGMNPDKKYHYETKGLNSRLDTIQAVILLEKLKVYDDIHDMRMLVGNRMCSMLNYRTNKKYTGNFHQLVITLDSGEQREKLQKHMTENNIPTCRFYPVPIHMQKAYADLGYKEGDFPVAEDMCKRNLAIPISPFLSKKEQDYIVNTANNCTL